MPNELAEQPEAVKIFFNHLHRHFRDGTRPSGSEDGKLVTSSSRWTPPLVRDRLAELNFDVSPKTINNWFSGKHLPHKIGPLELLLFGKSKSKSKDDFNEIFHNAYNALYKIKQDLQSSSYPNINQYIVPVPGTNNKVIHINSPSFYENGAIQILSPYKSPIKFVGRTAELDQMQRWLDKKIEVFLSVAVISGDSGVGKTRTAVEFIKKQKDWQVGILSADELGRIVSDIKTSCWIPIKPTIIIIDYASQKTDLLRQWFDNFAEMCLTGAISKNAASLRVILIDREASWTFSWLYNVFGSKFSQTNPKLVFIKDCECVNIKQIQDETHIAEIIDQVLQYALENRLPAVKRSIVDEVIDLSSDRYIIRSNPLMLQIAVLEASYQPTKQRFTKIDLLDTIVKREINIFEHRCRRYGIPDFLLPSVHSLRACSHLVGGLEIQQLYDLVEQNPEYNNLGRSGFTTIAIEILCRPDDDGNFESPRIEPDLAGDLYSLRTIRKASTISHVFDVGDAYRMGPRLWRLLDDFKSCRELVELIGSWIEAAALSKACSTTVGLDNFIKDASSGNIELVAKWLPGVMNRLTQGLQRGDSTGEIWLTSEAHRPEIIASSLRNEARVLQKTGAFQEALNKINESNDILMLHTRKTTVENFQKKDLVSRLSTLWIQIRCFEGLEDYARLDEHLNEARLLCEQAINNNVFWVEEEDCSGWVDLLAETKADGSAVLSSRGFSVIIGPPALYDVRLDYAMIVQKILSRSTLLQDIVICSANNVWNALLSDRHETYSRQADLLQEKHLEFLDAGAADYSQVFANNSKIYRHKSNAAMINLIQSFVWLRSFIIAAYSNDQAQEKINDLAETIQILLYGCSKLIEIRLHTVRVLGMCFSLAMTIDQRKYFSKQLEHLFLADEDKNVLEIRLDNARNAVIELLGGMEFEFDSNSIDSLFCWINKCEIYNADR